MSDRSVEDELVAEARKFSASMRAAMRHYAQASNWLERRRARREISLITRQEAREQSAARQRHLVYSEQAVDKYRVHALAVSQRANDPTVDHSRRFRDQQVLARHRADMRDLLLSNPHLSEVEKGIGLDGLDAATAFPEFETGKLFNRAHKVKGIEALRYRAHVARETAAVRHRDTVAALQWHEADARQADEIRNQQERVVEDPARFRAVVGWTDRNGVTASRSKSFGSEQAATAWMRSNPDLMLTFGVAAHAQTWDTRDDRAPIYSHSGEHRAVWASLAAREKALAGQHERPAGQARTDSDQEPPRAERDSLKARLHLSIEHNSELADNNARLTRQLTEVSAERDQLRFERDEAVRKLADRTPAEQRFGSPERQAEQARTHTREATESGSESAPRSPLADYQPGHALADAVARNGRDREGMQR
ncbi:hypothetical protein ACW2Q0_13275 [Nocardia sp. R16R-3T]